MPHHYDRTLPWNVGVQGEQVLAFINDDFAVFRMQAGAGTGKTFGLRRRVLRIRHPAGLDVPHGRVLVCAFNRVIARDLEREIRAELEPLGLALPAIKTVHALCSMLLGGQLPRLLLSRETEEMLYDVLETHAVLRTQYSHPAAVRALRELQAYYVTRDVQLGATGSEALPFAPPTDLDNLVTRLWDQFLPGWRERHQTKPGNAPEAPDVLRRMPGDGEVIPESEWPVEPDFVVVKKRVAPQRGRWRMTPRKKRTRCSGIK